MKQLYNHYFPTPSYLAMRSCAIDISDQTIKYGELDPTSKGLRVGRYGQVKIPPGIVVSGKIVDSKKVVNILRELALRLKLTFVRVSLPEEQMYLFTLSMPKIGDREDLKEAILLQIEEHIPLKASDTTFDYSIISENNETVFVEVAATASNTIESYVQVFQDAGLTPISFELEAQAIARAIIPQADKSPVMIVDFGETRTGVSIAYNGRVLFTTTLDIGGEILTNMIAKNLSMTFAEAEKLKRTYGTDESMTADEVFPIIINGISVLRDELNKHYLYWKTHNYDGAEHEPISRIILCGGGANLPGVADYLEASMKVKVEHANVWVNILDPREYIPDMSRKESLDYATVFGLALGDYAFKLKSMINVLPEEEKRSLVREYWTRLAGVSMFFVIIIALLSSLLLLPSYYISHSKERVISSQLESFEGTNTEVAKKNFNTIVTDINSKLGFLSGVESNYQVRENVLARFNTLPKGITLTQIVYNERSDKTRLVELHGRALDRNTLSLFKQTLDTNPNFTGVNLPISNYLERSNLSFSVTINLK
jgi:type IV pilus assembly protein PilM